MGHKLFKKREGQEYIKQNLFKHVKDLNDLSTGVHLKARFELEQEDLKERARNDSTNSNPVSGKSWESVVSHFLSLLPLGFASASACDRFFALIGMLWPSAL